MPQLFDTATVLRLEVQREAETGETFNDLANPDGDLGGYGWVTTVTGSLMRGVFVSDQWRLRYRTTAAVPNWFTSEAVPAAPGEWAAARWDNTSIPDYVRGQVEFLDDDGAVVGTSGQTGYLTTGSTGQVAASQAPAGTVQARLRIDVYGNASGGNPPAAVDVDFRQAALATAATSAELPAPLPALEPAPYTDVLGPTHDIKITREELNVGTLTATINDSDLDPATSTLVRPGRRTRVLLIDEEGAVPEPLFVGRILTAQVSYNLLYPVQAKRARIALTAVDNVSPLSAAKRAEGVAEVDELPFVIEGAGVPWNVNGSGNQVQTAEVTAVNDNATALDQVAITRDTTRGYAWVSRRGILNVWDRDLLPATVVDTLDDTVYNGDTFEIGYDLAGCINSVTVTVTAVNADTLDTEQVTYGPYTNPESIAEYGLQSADFTVYGLTAAQVPAYAQAILDSNATPQVRVNALTIPIDTLEELPRALLDLYDLVTITNTRAALSQDSRITSLEHTITPEKWLVRFGFAPTGAVAPPTTTPTPTSGASVKPKAPTGLDVDAAVVFAGSQPQVTLTASWDAVTQNSDDSDLVNLDHYELQTKIGAPASLVSWAPVATTGPDELEVTLAGYPVDQEISARVRAVNTKGIGGDWSTPVSTAGATDLDGPATPSTPATETRLGVIRVRWDGLNSGGLPMVNGDFSYIEVHASTTNGFTPTKGDPNTLLDTLFGPGYALKTDGAYGVNWYFKLIAVDTSGNASAPSAQASAATQALVNTDLIGEVISGANIQDGTITASDKIIGNTITGALIQALTIEAGHIKANAITADKIEAGAIDTIHLSADAVTADKISADAFDAITITGDQITGGTIAGVTYRTVSTSGRGFQLVNYGLYGDDESGNRRVTIETTGATAGRIAVGGYVAAETGFRLDNGVGSPTGIRITSSFAQLPATDVGGNLQADGNVSGAKVLATNPSTDATAVPNIRRVDNEYKVTSHANSSIRYKRDVETLDLDDEQMFGLRPVRYRLRKKPGDRPADHVFYGFIAEEMQALGLDALLEFDKQGRPDEVDYVKLVTVAMAAVRRLHARVTQLEAQA